MAVTFLFYIFKFLCFNEETTEASERVHWLRKLSDAQCLEFDEFLLAGP